VSAATLARPDPRTTTVKATDEELVARVGRGDRDALGELYRRHRGVVRGYVLGRIARADDADDVVQETFLRAAKEAGDYRAENGYRVPVWLCWQAGAQLRDYGRNTLHPYLAAARSAREQLHRPVTETAAQREATPLSEPVRAALGKLTPGERRAIQLRYIDGLTPDQAAEIVGVRKRSFHRRVSYGRRKLAKELADLAPQARSPLQDMPRPEAYTRALAATGNDVPAATAWLHRHGIRASDDTLYRHRHNLQTGTTTQVERPRPERPVRQPARPAYTPPEHVTALTNARDRARAAATDYRTRFGHLPTRREVMTAASVSESTAMRALRPLKAEPTATAHGEASRAPARVGDAADAPAVPSARSLTPTRQPGTHRRDPRTGADRTATTQLHAQTDDAPRREQDDTKSGERDAGSRGVAIERTRTAVALLAAQRQFREQRRETETDRAAQLNRWHHDDAQQAAARARDDWGMAR
jgi:RNA polymerase sigma-70 factor (ECF subfamily)